MNLWRNLIINNEEELVVDEPLEPITIDNRFVIVGASDIDGDVRAGVYSVLDKQNLTLVSGRSSSSNTITGGFTITWGASSNTVTCSVGDYGEKMHLNIISNITNKTIRIAAHLIASGIDKTIYFDVNCTYAPADYVINNLTDYNKLKNAINNGTETTTYPGATTGCSNLRFRLGANITLNYGSNGTDYAIGVYNNSTRDGKYFGGIFDGADYTITISGYVSDSLGHGGIFNFTQGATIKNLRTAGSFTTNNRRGVIVFYARDCKFERIFMKTALPKGSSYSYQYTGGLLAWSIAYYNQNGTVEDTTRSYAAEVQDVCVISNIVSNGHSCSLAFGRLKSINRAFMLGSLTANTTSYNIGVFGALIGNNPAANAPNEVFAKNIFSKEKLSSGQDNYRFIVGTATYVPKEVKNIIDLNIGTSSSYSDGITAIRYKENDALAKFSNIYTTQTRNASTRDGNIPYNGTTKTFSQLCQTPAFDSDWIKGAVGTPIINNQYATEPDVLLAAKDENYYGNV